MPPRLMIQLSQGMTSWSWVVVSIDDEDEFVTGSNYDYTTACIEAREAHDDWRARRAD